MTGPDDRSGAYLEAGEVDPPPPANAMTFDDDSNITSDRSSPRPLGAPSGAAATVPHIHRQKKTVLHCPYPSCHRTFQSGLWRLRVHYRAQPTARGSGVERGHGTELVKCPQCEAPVSGASLKGLCDCFFRPAGGLAPPPPDQQALTNKSTQDHEQLLSSLRSPIDLAGGTNYEGSQAAAGGSTPVTPGQFGTRPSRDSSSCQGLMSTTAAEVNHHMTDDRLQSLPGHLAGHSSGEDYRILRQTMARPCCLGVGTATIDGGHEQRRGRYLAESASSCGSRPASLESLSFQADRTSIESSSLSVRTSLESLSFAARSSFEFLDGSQGMSFDRPSKSQRTSFSTAQQAPQPPLPPRAHSYEFNSHTAARIRPQWHETLQTAPPSTTRASPPSAHAHDTLPTLTTLPNAGGDSDSTLYGIRRSSWPQRVPPHQRPSTPEVRHSHPIPVNTADVPATSSAPGPQLDDIDFPGAFEWLF